MTAGSYAYLGEAEVVGAGAALLGEAAGPPPATALPGEVGGASAAAAALLGEAVVAAAALEGEAAAAAVAALEGEAAAAAAAAGGAAAAAAAGRCVPIILAIGSITPALTACFLPPADFADRLVTSSSQSASKSSMCSLCCFSTNARNLSRVVASTLML